MKYLMDVHYLCHMCRIWWHLNRVCRRGQNLEYWRVILAGILIKKTMAEVREICRIGRISWILRIRKIKLLVQGRNDQQDVVMPPFKAWQVHGISADGKIFMELLGCLACLYSWVGEPCMLQAVCLSAMSWPLLPSVAPIVTPVPVRVSHHHRPQQGVPTCLSTTGEQRRQDARTLYNIILHMWAHFILWEPFIRPSPKAMRTLFPLVTQTPGWGSHTACITLQMYFKVFSRMESFILLFCKTVLVQQKDKYCMILLIWGT